MRGFKQHHGALLSLQFLQALAALVGLGRQEALKAEAAARQATAYQRGGDSAWAGDADHAVPSCAGGRHQQLAGIGDARQPGVTDHGQGFAGGEGREQFGDAGGLVVGVEAQQPRPLVFLA